MCKTVGMRRIDRDVEDQILALHAAGRSLRVTQKLLAADGVQVSRGTINNVCRRAAAGTTIDILLGDCREILPTLPEASAQCFVTSPPYFGLRDYGHAGQIGREATPQEYVETMVTVFRLVRRVLRADGTVWLNLGDTYNTRARVRASSHQPALNGVVDDSWAATSARGGVRMPTREGGLKEKDLILLPWRVALALQADGWHVRQYIVWHKTSSMPESVRDRPTGAHEAVFLLSRSRHYYYDGTAIAEPAATGRKQEAVGTRNRRNVWSIPTEAFAGAHFATMPSELARLCIRAGSRPGDLVIDPFGGAGTTALAARQLGRRAILIELRPSYVAMARLRSV